MYIRVLPLSLASCPVVVNQVNSIPYQVHCIFHLRMSEHSQVLVFLLIEYTRAQIWIIHSKTSVQHGLMANLLPLQLWFTRNFSFSCYPQKITTGISTCIPDAPAKIVLKKQVLLAALLAMSCSLPRSNSDAWKGVLNLDEINPGEGRGKTEWKGDRLKRCPRVIIDLVHHAFKAVKRLLLILSPHIPRDILCLSQLYPILHDS